MWQCAFCCCWLLLFETQSSTKRNNMRYTFCIAYTRTSIFAIYYNCYYYTKIPFRMVHEKYLLIIHSHRPELKHVLTQCNTILLRIFFLTSYSTVSFSSDYGSTQFCLERTNLKNKIFSNQKNGSG